MPWCPGRALSLPAPPPRPRAPPHGRPLSGRPWTGCAVPVVLSPSGLLSGSRPAQWPPPRPPPARRYRWTRRPGPRPFRPRRSPGWPGSPVWSVRYRPRRRRSRRRGFRYGRSGRRTPPARGPAGSSGPRWPGRYRPRSRPAPGRSHSWRPRPGHVGRWRASSTPTRRGASRSRRPPASRRPPPRTSPPTAAIPESRYPSAHFHRGERRVRRGVTPAPPLHPRAAHRPIPPPRQQSHHPYPTPSNAVRFRRSERFSDPGDGPEGASGTVPGEPGEERSCRCGAMLRRQPGTRDATGSTDHVQ